jgi:hypothetical protein
VSPQGCGTHRVWPSRVARRARPRCPPRPEGGGGGGLSGDPSRPPPSCSGAGNASVLPAGGGGGGGGPLGVGGGTAGGKGAAVGGPGGAHPLSPPPSAGTAGSCAGGGSSAEGPPGVTPPGSSGVPFSSRKLTCRTSADESVPGVWSAGGPSPDPRTTTVSRDCLRSRASWREPTVSRSRVALPLPAICCSVTTPLLTPAPPLPPGCPICTPTSGATTAVRGATPARCG